VVDARGVVRLSDDDGGVVAGRKRQRGGNRGAGIEGRGRSSVDGEDTALGDQALGDSRGRRGSGRGDGCHEAGVGGVGEKGDDVGGRLLGGGAVDDGGSDGDVDLLASRSARAAVEGGRGGRSRKGEGEELEGTHCSQFAIDDKKLGRRALVLLAGPCGATGGCERLNERVWSGRKVVRGREELLDVLILVPPPRATSGAANAQMRPWEPTTCEWCLDCC
jgi:hypothetical protein